MATLTMFDKFVRGLDILRPHYDGGDGFHIGAKHDEFFAYATVTPLSEEEFNEMKSLGWSQPDVPDNDVYDPQEGWRKFV